MTSVTCDVLILGGGVSGLWCLHTLQEKGFQTILVDDQALGSGQTLASQGVLHGGLKYALNGVLNDASEAIAGMPQKWDECLRGNQQPDLRQVKVLSDRQVLFSRSSLNSRVAAFFAGKSTAGRSYKIPQEQRPDCLRPPNFQGNVYALEEKVIDIETLLQALAAPFAERLLLAQTKEIQASDSGEPVVTVVHQTESLRISAKRLVIVAGSGIPALLQLTPYVDRFPTQTRRLHQVSVKHPSLSPLFGVAIGSGPKPPFVVTSYRLAESDPWTWYLGGELAEQGVSLGTEDQLDAARSLLVAYFPKLDLEGACWKTLRVDRAEPLQADGQRPKEPVWKSHQSVYVGWPSKLVMAPLLAQRLTTLFEKENFLPQASTTPVLSWPRAEPGRIPWLFS